MSVSGTLQTGANFPMTQLPIYRRMPKVFGCSLLLPCAALSSSARAQQVQFNSPQNRVQFTLNPAAGGLAYSVKVQNRTALESSPLGIKVDNQYLGQGAVLGKSTTCVWKETYLGSPQKTGKIVR